MLKVKVKSSNWSYRETSHYSGIYESVDESTLELDTDFSADMSQIVFTNKVH